MFGFRTALCGACAIVFVTTGAAAADLPLKAKAVEYVKVCSNYGAGFYYIPGTDTCLKIGGALRLDTVFNGGTYDAPFIQGGPGGNNIYTKNYYASRERFTLSEDTRTSTEYGVLRTYANLQIEFLQDRDSIAGGFLATDYAFIQFAGFTLGKAVSQFDPQWTLARPHMSSGYLNGSFNPTGLPQLAYTATFGSGFSATFALENASPYRNAGLYNTSGLIVAPGAGQFQLGGYGSASNTFLGNSTGGNHYPDVVSNLRLDQAWGTLHLAAAAHNESATFYGSTDATGHPDENTWGYAITGALSLIQLPTGKGDRFLIEAGYADGAAKYLFGGSVDILGGGRFSRVNDRSIGFGYVLDGIFSGVPGSQIIKSSAWQVDAAFEHYWTPLWRSSVFGSYSHISYGSSGDALLFAAFGGNGGVGAGRLGTSNSAGSSTSGSLSSSTTGSFDLGIAQIGTKTSWTPVKDLTLSVEFLYSRIDQNLSGTYTGTMPGRAAQTYQLSDQNAYNGAVQILRSF